MNKIDNIQGFLTAISITKQEYNNNNKSNNLNLSFFLLLIDEDILKTYKQGN